MSTKNDWAKNVFAYPLPHLGTAKREKGMAAHDRDMQAYHDCWKNVQNDDNWTVQDNDLKHALDHAEGRTRLTKARVVAAAKSGHILLCSCADREAVERFVSRHHYAASMATLRNDRQRLAEISIEFKESNRELFGELLK